MMKDFLYRGILNKLDMRFSYALTTKLANTAILSHNCGPMSGHILGRALTAGVLAAPLLTEEERLTFRWTYEGALRTVVVDAGAAGDVRGFVSPTDLSQLAETTDEIFGPSCKMTVIKGSGTGILANSTIQSIFRDPIEDLCHFYCVSDQIESAMIAMIGFNPDPENPVQLCHGILLQALPDCDLERFDRIRNRMNQPDTRTLLSQMPETDNYFETVIRQIVQEECPEALGDINLIECPTPAFKCNCSPERMLRAVQTLPPEEKQDILEKEEHLFVNCHFCSKRHELTFDLLKKALT